MNISPKTHVRGKERRKKRFIIPIVYFIAEGVLAWLVLLLIQVEFNMQKWDLWAVILFIVGLIYSIAKTVNVFQRQKDYPEVKDE